MTLYPLKFTGRGIALVSLNADNFTRFYLNKQQNMMPTRNVLNEEDVLYFNSYRNVYRYIKQKWPKAKRIKGVQNIVKQRMRIV